MRLSPRTIPYRVLANGGQIGGLVLFGVVTSTGPGRFGTALVLGLAVAGVGLTVAWELARFRRFEYEPTAETFDIRSGVLSRREREIPYERIQNVDVAQNVVQRLLDIAEVRIETAGGSGTEASLRYVSTAEADRLRELVSSRKREGAAEETEESAEGRELFRLSAREHVVLGLVSADLRLLGVLSVAVSALSPQVASRLGPRFDLVSVVGPALALVGIVGFWALSGALQVLRYYGFGLFRHGDELRYERGAFQRFSGTIPLSKVQTLAIEENVLARALGYASLVIGTAGYAPGQDSSRAESAVPIAERSRALSLARDVEPFGELEFRRPPERARLRYAVRYALAVLGVTALARAGYAVTDLLALWYLPLAGLVAVPLAAHLTWKHRGYYADEEYVVTRNGFWRHRTIVVPYDRVQTVVSSQSVFQRRRDLGTVTIDTASSGGLGGEAVAVDVDASVAERLREETATRLQGALARASERRAGLG